jgi:hypothetical protein
MKSMEDLQDYIEKTEDVQVGHDGGDCGGVWK